MKKLSASFLAAASVGLMLLLLRRRLASRRDAVLLTLAYAFATNTWVTSSQALWQQCGAELLLVAALLALTAEVSTWSLAAAGLSCGLLVANRPSALSIAAVLAAYAFSIGGRRIVAFLAPAAVVAALLVAYNLSVFGRLTGGYGLILTPAFFSHGPLPGLAGLLFSPGKGLLAFSPFLLFLAKPVRRDRLDLCLAVAFALQLLTFAPTDWSGGYCYGPRFLVDSLPLVVPLLVPVVSSLGRVERIAFVALSVVGVLIQAIGAFCYPKGGSDWNLRAWSLVDSPMRLEAAAGLHPARFLDLVRKPPEPATVLGLVLRATTIPDGPRARVTVSLAPVDATPPPGLRISLDVYALVAPSHPRRHYGVWHLTLTRDSVPLDVGFDVDLAARAAHVTCRGQDVPPDDPRRAQWAGTVTNGEFVARLTVERLGSGESSTTTLFSFRRQGDAIEIPPAPIVERKL